MARSAGSARPAPRASGPAWAEYRLTMVIDGVRRQSGRLPALGEHTDEILAELG